MKPFRGSQVILRKALKLRLLHAWAAFVRQWLISGHLTLGT